MFFKAKAEVCHLFSSTHLFPGWGNAYISRLRGRSRGVKPGMAGGRIADGEGLEQVLTGGCRDAAIFDAGCYSPFDCLASRPDETRKTAVRTLGCDGSSRPPPFRHFRSAVELSGGWLRSKPEGRRDQAMLTFFPIIERKRGEKAVHRRQAIPSSFRPQRCRLSITAPREGCRGSSSW